MRLAILAAEHAARAMPCAIARGISLRRLFDFQHHIERDAEAAAMLAIAAGAGAEFVTDGGMTRKMIYAE